LFHVKQPLSPTAFRAIAGADDETTKRLAAYLALLEKWQRQINLVGPGSMADPWRRHVLDSAQLVPLLPSGVPTVIDLGTGAGFPGVVLAIMSDARVHLVESNRRKCAFLAEVLRITGATATIHCGRIETLAPMTVDVVTARGCANLLVLLDYAVPLLSPAGVCLFLKGRSVEVELTESEKKWMMQTQRIPSRSDPTGVVLKLSEIMPRHDH
jgi:16S rRNA (guanine527-N7)-methyltransferase